MVSNGDMLKKIRENWQIIIFLGGVVAACVTLLANVKQQNEQLIGLDRVKADRATVEYQGNQIGELCERKLDKSVFQSHEKRDDDRFNLLQSENKDRLDRIENKLDRLIERTP